MNNKKIKAMFEIFLIISLVFIFSISNASLVYAQEENRVCCQKANIDGETSYCQYTERNNCDSSGLIFDNRCEDVSICRPVCCNVNNLGYYATGGQGCFKNVGEDYCKNVLNGEVISGASCNAPECQKGCCSIGSQCMLTTEQSCEDLTSTYPDLELQYNPEITNEVECSNVCRAQKKGCCITQNNQENNCNLITFNECKAQSGEFYEGLSCVNLPNNKCDHCVPGQREEKKTGCASDVTSGEDVYYYDKCGNPIIDEALAEDCDYAQGTLCREDEETESASCINLNCQGKKLWDNPFVDENFDGIYKNDNKASIKFNERNYRINGETWCEYDADAGPTRDLPGTRHYVHTCYEGEEQVVECEDYREEYCFQFDGLEQDVAKCLPNRAIENPCGACKDDSNPKRCCENRNLRDCVWISADTEAVNAEAKREHQEAEVHYNQSLPEPMEADPDEAGVCVPLVPPGTRYWESDDSLCNFASKEGENAIKVAWHNVGWGADWDCDSGCEAYTQKFAYGQNNLCRAQGDCGADYNLAGKWSGISFTRICDVGSEIKEDYGDGDTDVADYGGKHYGGDEVDSLIENCLEELPDPVDKTDGDYSFEKAILYTNSLSTELPPELGDMDFLITHYLGKLSGADIVVVSASLLFYSMMAATEVFTFFPTLTLIASTSAPYPVINIITFLVVLTILIVSFFTGGTSTEKVEITCKSWQPPLNSNDCNLCHEDEILTAGGLHHCTEYLCKSLGQNCQFFSETEEGPKCLNSCETADGGRKDINSPLMTPLLDLATKNVMKCRDSNDPSVGNLVDCTANNIVQGPSGGYDIKFVKENTDVVAGVETNELAVCKWDWERKATYGDLTNSFEQITAARRHTITLEADNDLLPEDKKTMWVMCQDLCGNNYNVPYSIDVEISKMIDIGPPMFEGITPESGSPVKNDLENDNFVTSLRLNEPATCRWSKTNDPYETMTNEFNCRASYLRGCDFVLTDLQQGINTFFIRCMDRTNNVNADALPSNDGYVLFRSNPLNITGISCKHSLGNECGTIYDRDFTLEVTTTGGGYNGESTCYYSGIEFFETDSFMHKQVIGPRLTGSYTENIRCVDDIGNEATEQINFDIVSDDTSPKILKVNIKDGNLNILTDEISTCKHTDNSNVIYDEMILFESTEGIKHSAIIGDKDYVHVKCRDRFNHVTSIDVYQA